MFWDFISLRPETTHQVSFLFSDRFFVLIFNWGFELNFFRGIPDGYRHMNGLFLDIQIYMKMIISGCLCLE